MRPRSQMRGEPKPTDNRRCEGVLACSTSRVTDRPCCLYVAVRARSRVLCRASGPSLGFVCVGVFPGHPCPPLGEGGRAPSASAVPWFCAGVVPPPPPAPPPGALDLPVGDAPGLCLGAWAMTSRRANKGTRFDACLGRSDPRSRSLEWGHGHGDGGRHARVFDSGGCRGHSRGSAARQRGGDGGREATRPWTQTKRSLRRRIGNVLVAVFGIRVHTSAGRSIRRGGGEGRCCVPLVWPSASRVCRSPPSRSARHKSRPINRRCIRS